MQCTQSVWTFISACCNMIFTAEAFRFWTVVYAVQYLCTLGYSDFNNLVGFSCLEVFLNDVCLKSFLKKNKSSHLIRFTKFYSVLYSVFPNFFLFFWQMGIQKMQDFYVDFISIKIFGKHYTHIKLFAKNCCQAIIEVGKLAIFYTSLVKNFLLSSFYSFFNGFKSAIKFWAFLIQ
jgi:hypothetical protein